ncbi:MAG: DUF1840 domain-containing protein [Burkholderiaceae bacterium]
MALVVFRSKAAGEIFMFAGTAHRIFEILGRKDTQRGVITAEDVPAALSALEAAVEAERALDKAADEAAELASRSGDGDDAALPRPITLSQRAWPLIDMLRAARKKSVGVTWGI